MTTLDLSNKEVMNINWRDTLNDHYCTAAPLSKNLGYCIVSLPSESKVLCINNQQLKDVLPKDELILNTEVEQDTEVLKKIMIRLGTDDVNYLVGFCSELSSRIKEMLPCQK